MKQGAYFLFILLALFILFSCGGKDEKTEALLKEAAQWHNEAVAIHKELMPKMKEIEALKAKLTAQKDSLIGKEDNTVSQLEVQIMDLENISKEMKEWMENIVEVPNNEEHHHHHEGEEHEHDHKHEHGAKIDLTPEQMLEVQKEMKANILKIQGKVKAILEKN
jgi:ABC-type nickel/cobalt efflux system permease component RcnA